MNLFFASLNSDLDGSYVMPKKPREIKGIVEGKTPRTCFYPSISQAISALGPGLKGKIIYLYQPNQVPPESRYVPTLQECPFKETTGEVWYLGQVRLKLVGQVMVIGVKSTETLRAYTPRLTELPWITWSYKEIKSTQTKMTSKVTFLSKKWLGESVILGPGTKVIDGKPIVQPSQGFIYKPKEKVKIYVPRLELVGSSEFYHVS